MRGLAKERVWKCYFLGRTFPCQAPVETLVEALGLAEMDEIAAAFSAGKCYYMTINIS
jgi:hypothetical protein